METIQQYHIRIKKEQDEILVKLNNERVKVLREHLISLLENKEKLNTKIVEEYNSIIILPF